MGNKKQKIKKKREFKQKFLKRPVKNRPENKEIR